MARNKVTQQLIADKLDISVATVSKAISGHSDVNSDTHTKVINMATKLGYDIAGRSKQQTSFMPEKHHLVGVFVSHKEDQWRHSNYFAGMSSTYAKMNISLLFHYCCAEDSRLIMQPEFQPPAMRDQLLSGVILVNQWPPNITKYLTLKVPCVSIINELPDLKVDVVGIDEFSGISKLMDHLHNLGHRKIGFFARTGVSNQALVRFGAYAASVYRLGLDFEPESVCGLAEKIVDDNSFTLDMQIKRVVEQIRRGVRAWMCTDNDVAYDLYRRLTDKDFRVPQDVSITGFGDRESERIEGPKFTYMAVPALSVGAEAVRRLLNRLRHPASPKLIVKLQCKFIKGATTAPPPKDLSSESS
ncbi:LacI family DNA-binding transcriptional regulator [Planctomycetota bacterium]